MRLPLSKWEDQDESHSTGRELLKLAQSLSALYPPGIDDERCWVDGVLVRKESLGL